MSDDAGLLPSLGRRAVVDDALERVGRSLRRVVIGTLPAQGSSGGVSVVRDDRAPSDAETIATLADFAAVLLRLVEIELRAPDSVEVTAEDLLAVIVTHQRARTDLDSLDVRVPW